MNNKINFFRLLENTRKFLVATSEELSIEDEAISTAISTFGLKKQTFDMFEDNLSDDSNLPSTSSQSPSTTSRQHSSSTSPTEALESEAINSAISSYGLHSSGI